MWKDLHFWEQFFWDTLIAKRHKDDKEGKEVGAGSAERRAINEYAQEQEGSVDIDKSVVEQLICEFGKKMLDWDIAMDTVKEFTKSMCEANSIATYVAKLLVSLILGNA